MIRSTDTRPEVRVGGFWLSSIVPQGWGELVHSTRTNGSWELSFTIPQNPLTRHWRHPALAYAAPLELNLGPAGLWSGALEEPDWDEGKFIAIGACRDGETALALDAFGNASTKPNEVIDAAIARGVLSWTRVGDFGNTPVGDPTSTGGVVTVQSVLDAWAKKNNSRWFVNDRRQLVIAPVDENDPKWFVVPGSGVLGSAGEERADRIFVRYTDSATGRRTTASYPATTPTGGVEKPTVPDDGSAMTAAAQTMAQSLWTDLKGRSGWTNGLTLTHGQITGKGGPKIDPALIKAGDTICLLGVPDVRGVAHNTNVILGSTEYEWEDDDLQANPVGLAARDTDSVLEQVGNLAVSAAAMAAAAQTANVFPAGTPFVTGAAPPAGTPMLIKTSTVVVAPTDAVGTISFNYAGGAFPNGVVSVVCTPGDDTANFNVIRMRGTSTLATFVGGAITNTGYVGAGSGIRINYIAVGW